MTTTDGVTVADALAAAVVPVAQIQPPVNGTAATPAPGTEAPAPSAAIPPAPLPGGTLSGNTLPGDALPGDALPGNALPGGAPPVPAAIRPVLTASPSEAAAGTPATTVPVLPEGAAPGVAPAIPQTPVAITQDGASTDSAPTAALAEAKETSLTPDEVAALAAAAKTASSGTKIETGAKTEAAAKDGAVQTPTTAAAISPSAAAPEATPSGDVSQEAPAGSPTIAAGSAAAEKAAIAVTVNRSPAPMEAPSVPRPVESAKKAAAAQSRDDKARGLTAPEIREGDQPLTARDLVSAIDGLVRNAGQDEQFVPTASSNAITDLPASAGSSSTHGHEAQASTNPLAAGPGQTTSTIIHAAQSVRPAPVVHSPLILGQITVQIQRAAEEGGGRVSIQLRPEELGRVGVDLDIQHDGHVLAVITADRPETLDALRRDSAALERALQDAGLKTDQQSLSFNLRGGDGNGGREQRGSSAPVITRAADPETTISARETTLQGGGALSGLNIRV